jgi:hypothetical protein
MPGFIFSEKHLSKSSKYNSYQGYHKPPVAIPLTCLDIYVEDFDNPLYLLEEGEMFSDSKIIIEFSDDVDFDSLVSGLSLEVNITTLTYETDYTIETITSKRFRINIINPELFEIDVVVILTLDPLIIKSTSDQFLTDDLLGGQWTVIEKPVYTNLSFMSDYFIVFPEVDGSNLSFMSNNFIFNPEVDGSNLSFMSDSLEINPEVDGSNLSFISDELVVPDPEINKVLETIEMTVSGGYDIYYTFNASSQPDDPDNTDTLYSTPIAYAEGYYKVVAYDSTSDIYSNIISEYFGSDVITDYIAYYKFNGNSNDETGNYNATNYNATTTTGVTGLADTAYYFNGTDAYHEINTTDFNLSNISISFWFTSEASSLYPCMISNNASSFWDGGFNIRHNNTGYANKITIHWNGGQGGDQDPALTSISDVSGTDFVHCMIIKTGTNLYLYINNILDNSRAINDVNINLSNGGKITFGRFIADGANGYCKCKLDNIRIYDRALTTNERTEIHILEKALAFYKCDDNLATTNIIDETSSFVGTSNRNTSLMSSIGVKGVANTAFAMNGTDDYYSSMIGAYVNKAYSFWFQIANTTGNKTLIFYGTSSGGNMATSDAIYVVNNRLQLYSYDGSQHFQLGTATLLANTWYHCIVNWVNSGNCTVYLNNILDITMAVGTRWSGGDRHWFAKDSADITCSLLIGKMDNVKIYNRNLIESERTAINNLEKP